MSLETDKHPSLVVECVNAHDRCDGTTECPYCEPVWPLRDAYTGRFVPHKAQEARQ